MKIYDNTLEAIKYIENSELEYSDKLCKINNILYKGITKVNDTILIVDEYGILD